ncbi:LacI family DNA-binding transcriptional regulator [Deinococcus sonorensis]|uniref:LacI family DNA-binding transcriptional regulator n=2 Tax=Deinococcus sonorensis TaxID=309891 RepID=A0AAU7UFF7_9DEIO
MKLKIKDVATAAGVSPATVSKVLTGQEVAYAINAATAERVRRVALELGYVPDAAARNLRTGRTGQLGVVLAATSPSEPVGELGELNAAAALRRTFDGAILAGLGEAARQHGVPALVVYPEGPEGEAARFLDGRIDGLLVSRDPLRPHQLLDHLDPQRLPLVALWTQQTPDAVGHVDADHRGGTRLATEHLLRLGHQQIVYYGAGREGPEHFALREQGYQDAMRAAGLGGGIQRTHASGRLVSLVEGGCTAVVAETDLAAAAVARTLNVAGLRVPQDVSLVGFDDMVGAEFIAGGLTTVYHPAAEMAAQGVVTLLARLAGHPPERLLVPTRLVVRRSTAPR